MNNTNTCNCPHHKLGGVLITIFGLGLLANALGWLASSTLFILISVLVIILGIKKMYRCKCCDNNHSM